MQPPEVPGEPPGSRARWLRSFGPWTVPAGQYFMMGDNRDDSHDSRFFGCVARGRVLGRSSRVVLSFDQEHWLLPRFSRFFQPIP